MSLFLIYHWFVLFFTIFQEDRFYNKYPCIVITAKGQPDVATRMFLARITNELKIPVLGLVDSDPYGLKILSVYMSGSKNMSYDSASLTTPNIQVCPSPSGFVAHFSLYLDNQHLLCTFTLLNLAQWLGLRPSDLNKYDLPEQCRLDMTENDIKTGIELMKEDFIQKNPKWMKELEIMVRTVSVVFVSGVHTVLSSPVVAHRLIDSFIHSFRRSR